MSWRAEIESRLPRMGHRNWLVLSDAAFPEFSRPGVVSVATWEPLPVVLREILAYVSRLRHVRPIAVVDAEFDALDEALCPGWDALRADLDAALEGLERVPTAHVELLEEIADASEMYTVLILKTTSTIPYSSVFLHFDCGYWTPEQEAKLRAKMGSEA